MLDNPEEAEELREENIRLESVVHDLEKELHDLECTNEELNEELQNLQALRDDVHTARTWVDRLQKALDQECVNLIQMEDAAAELKRSNNYKSRTAGYVLQTAIDICRESQED